MTKLVINTKSYETIPQQHRDIDLDVYVPDPNWLTEFILLCHPVTKAQLDKHIGPESTYNGKNLLRHSLKFHYAVLSGALNDVNPAFNIPADQRIAFIAKINEEIDQCSPGYHGRINSLLEGYFLPKTIADLLKLIRYNIVERAANKVTNEVHANNRFFIIAQQMGFGVQPKLAGDPYVGNISYDTIRSHLRQAFDEHFQPFSTLLELKSIIMSGFDKYIGRKEEGYPVVVYGPALEYFKNLFQEDELNYQYLITDEDVTIIYDINWNLILEKLWDTLIKDKYFDYSSISKSVGQLWLFKKLSKHLKSPTDYAIEAIKPIFLDPTHASEENLKLVRHLFKTPAECFAYIHCNPDLSNEAKTTVLLCALGHFLSKSTSRTDYLAITDLFWRFAFDNKKLTDTYGRTYAQTYPQIMEQTQAAYSQETYSGGIVFDTWMAADIKNLKVLSMKLRYLPEDSISALLNRAHVSSLFKALSTSKSDPEVMLSFVRLMLFVEVRKLESSLNYKDQLGQNILSIALSKTSTGHTEVTHKLLHIISTLPRLDQYHILQFDTPSSENNNMLLAIKHCPSAVPSMLNTLLTVNHETQNRITAAYLLNPVLRNKKHLCFKRLLELNQRVNALATQPNNIEAYNAAIQLQTRLIQALNVYFENKDNPNALPTLKTAWNEAITASRVHLEGLFDWTTLLKNLVLALVSIPLIGIPLAVNYYCSGYKRVFFQSEQVRGLEKLTEIAEDIPKFTQHI